jgi:predicted amidohydrolase YtcJ
MALAPDAVIVGGDIVTLDPALPRVEALAVLGGRIVARGSTAELRALAGPGTVIEDLGGATAIPGIVDSSATGFMWELGDAYIANRGQAAMRHMWPHRTLIDEGIPAPGHSDFAVCSMNPWTAIHAMVNRVTDTGGDLCRDEAVTVAEAIAAYTTLGAWSGREEGEKGALTVGRVADLAVLDRDPFAIDPSALKEVRTIATFVGGARRFPA